MVPALLKSKSLAIACEHRTKRIRFGYFKRKYDGKKIPRYKCLLCGKTFSDSTFKETFRQKKPYLNPMILHHLSGLMSQRRCSRILVINRKTVVRKLIFMGVRAEKFLIELNGKRAKCKSFQFDDLETFEHTKKKPLSVIMAVESKSRWIIGFKVASMQPKGSRQSQAALKKYGPRLENRKEKRCELFKEMSEFIEKDAHIQSDMNPHYEPDVKEYFPFAHYEQYKSRNAHAYGQGELKLGYNDPLFSLNHTFAMCRANLNRLIRKTWCTTKKQNHLNHHLAIYAIYHNVYLLEPKRQKEYLSQFFAA